MINDNIKKKHNDALDKDLKKYNIYLIWTYFLISLIGIITGLLIEQIFISKILLLISGILLGSSIEKLVSKHIRKSYANLLNNN